FKIFVEKLSAVSWNRDRWLLLALGACKEKEHKRDEKCYDVRPVSEPGLLVRHSACQKKQVCDSVVILANCVLVSKPSPTSYFTRSAPTPLPRVRRRRNRLFVAQGYNGIDIQRAARSDPASQ